MLEEYRKWLEENRKSLQEIDERTKKINELLKQADEFDNIDEFEQIEYRTAQENAIYEKTKDFGRTQFVREIALQINGNRKLENEINSLKEESNSNLDYISELQNDLLKLIDQNKELHNKIDKAIKYIEEHKRKDEFLNLNEWQTRDLLEILKDSDVDE